MFELSLLCPNAGPNPRFGSEDLPNLEPELRSGSAKFGVRIRFGTELWQHYTYAVDRSFNSISVDGDMSTNDVLANGATSNGFTIDGENKGHFWSLQARID